MKKFVLLFNCRLLLLDQQTAFSPTITHVITDEIDSKDSLVCTLTRTVVYAIAQHCFVLSYRWICECLQQNVLVNEEQYEIEGDHLISAKHNGPRRSRLSKQPLLPINHFRKWSFRWISKKNVFDLLGSYDQRCQWPFSWLEQCRTRWFSLVSGWHLHWTEPFSEHCLSTAVLSINWRWRCSKQSE